MKKPHQYTASLFSVKVHLALPELIYQYGQTALTWYSKSIAVISATSVPTAVRHSTKFTLLKSAYALIYLFASLNFIGVDWCQNKSKINSSRLERTTAEIPSLAYPSSCKPVFNSIRFHQNLIPSKSHFGLFSALQPWQDNCRYSQNLIYDLCWAVFQIYIILATRQAPWHFPITHLPIKGWRSDASHCSKLPYQKDWDWPKNAFSIGIWLLWQDVSFKYSFFPKIISQNCNPCFLAAERELVRSRTVLIISPLTDMLKIIFRTHEVHFFLVVIQQEEHRHVYVHLH